MENYKHTTVLLDEAVNGLNIRPDGIYIDGTFGRGGHSRLILSGWVRKDACWLSIATRRRLPSRKPSMIPAFPSYMVLSQLAEYVGERNLTGKIDGILLDLGVSSRSLTMRNAAFLYA